MPRLRRPLLTALALVAAPAALWGQGGLAAGPRAASAPASTPRRAPVAAPPRAPRLAPLLIAHRVELGLTDAQVTRLVSVATQLDLVVSPLEAEIDSLTLRGDATEWSRVDSARGAILRDQVRRRSALVAAVHDELLLARGHALEALTETQQRSALELEEAERKAETERMRGAVRGGGWNGVNQRP